MGGGRPPSEKFDDEDEDSETQRRGTASVIWSSLKGLLPGGGDPRRVDPDEDDSDEGYPQSYLHVRGPGPEH